MRNVFSVDLNTVTESLLTTVFGSEFQTAGAEHRQVHALRDSRRCGRLTATPCILRPQAITTRHSWNHHRNDSCLDCSQPRRTFAQTPDAPTNFGDHRLRGFWVAWGGGRISPFLIDFHGRPYNCRSTVRVCVSSVSAVGVRKDGGSSCG